MPVNLKALGLAVVAVWAVSAAVASAASAQTLEVELGTGSGFVTATSTNDVFTAGGSQITCNHAEFTGAATSPTTKLSITPKYTGCTAFGLANTHFADEGCTLDLRLVNWHASGLTQGQVRPELNCGVVGRLLVTPTWPIFGGSVCTIEFGTQGTVSVLPLTVLTAPSPDDLQLGPGTVSFLNYTVTKTGLGCPAIGKHSDGSYHVSQTTLRGFFNASHTIQTNMLLSTN